MKIGRDRSISANMVASKTLTFYGLIRKLSTGFIGRLEASKNICIRMVYDCPLFPESPISQHWLKLAYVHLVGSRTRLMPAGPTLHLLWMHMLVWVVLSIYIYFVFMYIVYEYIFILFTTIFYVHVIWTCIHKYYV